MVTSNFMKKLSMASVGAVVISLGLGREAQAVTINFDNLNTSNGNYAQVPTGYGLSGLTWDNFSALNANSEGGGFANAEFSGTNVAFNRAGFSATITSNNFLFDVGSAFLTAGRLDDLQVLVEGSRDNQLRYATILDLNDSAAIRTFFDFQGINSLTFTPIGVADVSGVFAIDNLNMIVSPDSLPISGSSAGISTLGASATAVPEPGSVGGVLVVGALGLASLMKRKKQG